jgi:TP901 family phage tail tape measure protein
MAAVIGALRADLSAGWAEFASDMGKAADSVKGFGKTFRSVAADLRGAGLALSTAITLPVVAFGFSAVTASKDFEAGMNRVKAATGAAGAELDKLREKARAIGADPGNTANAIQAADAMEILAKNGLTVQQILEGAADATTKLAAATGAELGPAADAATDVMLQFGKSAKDLDGVVDGITGTLLASKFGFEDYRLALGQAGGVAGGLGVEFTEFNAVIAATSALFGSGSDAGTSFKTFLTSLSGNSVEAKNAIKAYGLEFFDAEGNMRSMAAIAEELQTKLGGLNEEAKTDVLKRIFGTDAMRTAIGLMKQGREGIEALDQTIQNASADEQMAARMAGLSGALTQFGKALTELKLAIGDSGLLEFLTDMVKGVTELVRSISTLPKPILAVVTGLAGFVAALGPALFITGAFMGALNNLRPIMGIVGAGFTTLIRIIPGLTAVTGALRIATAALLGPWGLAVVAIAALVGGLFWLANRYSDAAVAARRLKEVTDNGESAIANYGEALRVAAGKTGKAKEEAMKLADALRQVALRAIEASRQLAQTQINGAIALQSEAADRRAVAQRNRVGQPGGNVRAQGQTEMYARQAEQRAAAARQRADAAIAVWRGQKSQEEAITAGGGVAPTVAPSGGPGGSDGIDLAGAGGGGGGRGGRERQGPTVEELERQHEMDRARFAGDQAALDAAQDLEERKRRLEEYEKAGLSNAAAQAKADSEVAEIATLRADEYARAIAEMGEGVRLSVAQATGDMETVRAIERGQDLRARVLDYQREGVTLAEAERKAAYDVAQIESGRAAARARWIADDQRRLEISNAQARGDAGEVERLTRVADVEARIRELRENTTLTEEQARAQAQTEANDQALSDLLGTWREFNVEVQRDDYRRGMAELNRLLESGLISLEAYKAAVAGLGDTLNTNLAKASPTFGEWSKTVDLFGDTLEDALTPGTDLKSLWDSFRTSLLKILVLEPLVRKFKDAMKGMGGGADAGGIPSLPNGSAGGWGTILNLGKSFMSLFGGGRAKGGRTIPTKGYLVGEEGPEWFRPDTAGNIIPGDAMSAGPSAGLRIGTLAVSVDARDAVLTDTVKEWVADGVGRAVQMAVPAAVNAAREAVPAEMAARAQDQF